ncbi:hypothetical protein [Candidatus Absconditicoccus praedator]|uniref:hypothetical protein n=1 Tax=Candidatus Absconditicoccus praedator TaxID=2735562 RepID=UPI001E3AC07C|nr:hypothetical protein [Candidatus Absconditicoccus praedator]UFX83340.1 hypothetical protein HLG78_04395 [Candidatus Absconditicoccus praedator]
MKNISNIESIQIEFLQEKFGLPSGVGVDFDYLRKVYQEIIDRNRNPVVITSNHGDIIFINSWLKDYIGGQISDVLTISDIQNPENLRKDIIKNKDNEQIGIRCKKR